MDIELSCRDKRLLYTSGGRLSPEFRIDIQGDDLENVDKLQITEKEVTGEVLFSLINTAEEFPATIYIPDTTRMQLSIGVCRGPLHGEEICETDVTLQLIDMDENVVSENVIHLEG